MPAKIMAPVAEPLKGGLGDTRWLCRLLSISQPSFWRWLAAGKIGPEPITLLSQRKHHWPVDECMAWVASGCVPREQWRRMKAGGSYRLHRNPAQRPSHVDIEPNRRPEKAAA